MKISCLCIFKRTFTYEEDMLHLLSKCSMLLFHREVSQRISGYATRFLSRSGFKPCLAAFLCPEVGDKWCGYEIYVIHQKGHAKDILLLQKFFLHNAVTPKKILNTKRSAKSYPFLGKAEFFMNL